MSLAVFFMMQADVSIDRLQELFTLCVALSKKKKLRLILNHWPGSFYCFVFFLTLKQNHALINTVVIYLKMYKKIIRHTGPLSGEYCTKHLHAWRQRSVFSPFCLPPFGSAWVQCMMGYIRDSKTSFCPRSPLKGQQCYKIHEEPWHFRNSFSFICYFVIVAFVYNKDCQLKCW